ncbi:V-type ATP synthase subunit D [Streptomyces sp. NPDC059649]|uniref:V-type ATP synthase subunit D n=1 Tax=Streptomyces sp. NPDC059649 TaxID=3346895 RepID=UPI0036B1AD2E
MTSAARASPSRAGRLRLRRSLDVALRGADLLEQKLHILQVRHEALRDAERTCAGRWHENVAVAETWLLRALLLGGEQALAAAAEGMGPAEVTVDETSTMGVRHPSGASCSFPDRDPVAAAPRNTALAQAEAAYREAVRAAADYAAARAAARLVGAELLRVRHRVRALRRHWIPRLEEALARVGLALEQTDHEDAVRRRWAAQQAGSHE